MTPQDKVILTTKGLICMVNLILWSKLFSHYTLGIVLDKKELQDFLFHSSDFEQINWTMNSTALATAVSLSVYGLIRSCKEMKGYPVKSLEEIMWNIQYTTPFEEREIPLCEKE